MKKFLATSLLIAFAATFGLGAEEESGELVSKAFQTEKTGEGLVVNNNEIFVVSSFLKEDHLTCLDVAGNYRWNVKFTAQIVAWKVYDNYIFVFSKDRLARSTYVTCIDRFSGMVVWQRP